ncbi:hypothetical protein ACFL6U_03480 [Planctomycetota bacterium]
MISMNRGTKLNLAFDKELPTCRGCLTDTSARRAIPIVWDMNIWTNGFDKDAITNKVEKDIEIARNAD